MSDHEVIENVLLQFLEHAQNIASFRFEQPVDNVVNEVISRKRKLCRDAKPHEVRLAALCAGEPILSKIKSDLIYRPSRSSNAENRSEQEVARFLGAAKLLNEMCDETVYSKQIQQREQKYANSVARLNHQATELNKRKAETNKQLSLQQQQQLQQQNSPAKLMSNHKHEAVRRRIDEVAKAVLKSEEEVQSKQSEAEHLMNELKVQREFQEQLLKLKQIKDAQTTSNSQNIGNANKTKTDKEELRRRLAERKQKASQIDKQLEAFDIEDFENMTGGSNRTNDGIATASSSRPVSPQKLTAEWKAKSAALFNESVRGSEATTDTGKMLKLLETIRNKLETRKRYFQARTVYLRSLNFNLAQCNNDKDRQVVSSSSLTTTAATTTTTTTADNSADIDAFLQRIQKNTTAIDAISSFFIPQKEDELNSIILIKLFDIQGHKITRAELISYIKNLKKPEESNLKDEQPSTAGDTADKATITTDIEHALMHLEGRDLISTVRSKDASDAVIKLNF